MTAAAPADLTGALVRYDRALTTVDPAAAMAVVEDLLADGVGVVDVLVDVIAAGQRQIGLRWQRGEWSVAQEHAATGVASAATDVIARFTRGCPVTRGRVVVACAEREWHALPATVIGSALRSDGWDVTLLGPATPPLRLAQHLDDLGPEATAISCSVLGALPATRRFVEASTAGGIPVLVGGAAFGRDDVRAGAIGATAWAPGAREAVHALRALPPVVSFAAPLPPDELAEQRGMELAHSQLAARIRDGWALAADVTVGREDVLDGIRAAARDAVDQVLHAVQATLLTDDHRIIEETRDWVADVLRGRGGDERLADELGRLVESELREFPVARDLVRRRWLGEVLEGPHT